MPAEAAAWQISQELGRTLSVGMLYKFESDTASTGIPRDVVKAAEKVYDASLEESISVYYNGTDEQDSGPDQATLERIIRYASRQRTYRRVPIVPGSKVWSAKNTAAETLEIFAVLGSARDVIKIGREGIRGVKPGTVLIFEPLGPDEPAPYDTWLLLSSKGNPDQQAIRYIATDGKPDLLYSDLQELPPLSMADWDIKGWAWAKAEPKGHAYPKFELFEHGIGPST